MRLLTLRIEEIIPYENNPRHNENAVDAVAESIQQCTYLQPIVVDENHVVLAGHTRLKALKQLEYDKAQCIVLEGLSEEKKKKYRYLDNKTAEAAQWDLEKLTFELDDLDLGELDFFNLLNEPFEVNAPMEHEGVKEYDAEEFDDEAFAYECPVCGFRFD